MTIFIFKKSFLPNSSMVLSMATGQQIEKISMGYLFLVTTHNLLKFNQNW